jgi:hypothetical protein
MDLSVSLRISHISWNSKQSKSVGVHGFRGSGFTENLSSCFVRSKRSCTEAYICPQNLGRLGDYDEKILSAPKKIDKFRPPTA